MVIGPDHDAVIPGVVSQDSHTCLATGLDYALRRAGRDVCRGATVPCVAVVPDDLALGKGRIGRRIAIDAARVDTRAPAEAGARKQSAKEQLSGNIIQILGTDLDLLPISLDAFCKD